MHGKPITPRMLNGLPKELQTDEPVLGYALGDAQAGGTVTVQLTREGERWLAEHGMRFPILTFPSEGE